MGKGWKKFKKIIFNAGSDREPFLKSQDDEEDDELPQPVAELADLVEQHNNDIEQLQTERGQTLKQLETLTGQLQQISTAFIMLQNKFDAHMVECAGTQDANRFSVLVSENREITGKNLKLEEELRRMKTHKERRCKSTSQLPDLKISSKMNIKDAQGKSRSVNFQTKVDVILKSQTQNGAALNNVDSPQTLTDDASPEGEQPEYTTPDVLQDNNNDP